jgi:pimeloyl-ACP methyl ester carboxylesterase
LRAAATGLPIDKLVLFGAPVVTDNSRPPIPADIATRVKALVDTGIRGEAVELFQLEAVGIPRPVVEKMRNAPFRPALEAMAHTLFYDLSMLMDEPNPRTLLPSIRMPTLVIDGGDGPLWIRHSAEVIAKGLPNGSHLSIPGLTQDIKAEFLAPPVMQFL